MTEQPKRSLMARLRASRKAQGLVRVEFCLTPAQVEKVKRYVARLVTTSSGTVQRSKK